MRDGASKYATTSSVRCAENKLYGVTSEGLSSLIVMFITCFAINCFTSFACDVVPACDEVNG